MHLVDLVSGLNRKIEQSIETGLKPFGFSIEQYRVLRALDADNGIPMGDLATKVFVDSPTLTKIIDKMVASGDVYRGPDPQDRRRVLVFISEKGAAIYAELHVIGEKVELELDRRLGERGRLELEKILSKILDDQRNGRTMQGPIRMGIS